MKIIYHFTVQVQLTRQEPYDVSLNVSVWFLKWQLKWILVFTYQTSVLFSARTATVGLLVLHPNHTLVLPHYGRNPVDRACGNRQPKHWFICKIHFFSTHLTRSILVKPLHEELGANPGRHIAEIKNQTETTSTNNLSKSCNMH